MIYAARDIKMEKGYELYIDAPLDIVRITIEDISDRQAAMTICVNKDDFIQIIKAMACNDELTGYDIVVTKRHEVE